MIKTHADLLCSQADADTGNDPCPVCGGRGSYRMDTTFNTEWSPRDNRWRRTLRCRWCGADVTLTVRSTSPAPNYENAWRQAETLSIEVTRRT